MRIVTFILIFSSVFCVSCAKEPGVEPSKPDVDYHYFKLSVNTAREGDDKPETDIGIIILPDNYSETGTPTPLVIYCHSGGGSVAEGSSEAQNEIIVKYLLSKGYAIVSVAGMPVEYSTRLDIDHQRTVGSFVAHRAYSEGYNYAIEHFNFRQDGCFVLCNSNGGLSMLNLHNLTDIPILAMSGICPLLSIELNGWHVKSGSTRPEGFRSYQNRANIIRIFGMRPVTTQEELENAIYEKDKVGQYDPYDYCFEHKEMGMKAPLLIFNPAADKTVLREHAKKMAMEMNARGGAQITLSDVEEYGGHGVFPNPIIVGEFSFRQEKLSVNLTTELIYKFFEEHGGK